MAKAPAKKKETEKKTETSAKKKKVTLNFEADPGEQVFVAGSFNDWSLEVKKKGNKSKLLKEDGEGKYSINMFLPAGEHEYKFFYKGQWVEDQNAEIRKQNAFGTFNSVMTVG